MQVLRLENSYQMCTRTGYYVNLFRVAAAPKKQGLSDVVLETLAIIAYKQPVTKADIVKIRGVKSDHAVNRLIEYNLVYEAGRLDAPGKPALFATTEEFLRRFGVSSTENLPEMDLEQKEEAEILFKKAIKLAKETEEFDHLAKICKRCSLYYQKYGNFDEALEMERKAYASQLMLNDGKSDSSVILSSALGMFGVMSLLLGLLWKKNRHALSQLDLFKE